MAMIIDATRLIYEDEDDVLGIRFYLDTGGAFDMGIESTLPLLKFDIKNLQMEELIEFEGNLMTESEYYNEITYKDQTGNKRYENLVREFELDPVKRIKMLDMLEKKKVAEIKNSIRGLVPYDFLDNVSLYIHNNFKGSKNMYENINPSQREILREFMLHTSRNLFYKIRGNTNFRKSMSKAESLAGLMGDAEDWIYYGTEDTGYFGGGVCELGHTLRYKHYAYSEELNKSIVFGSTCMTDFFDVTKELLEAIKRTQVETMLEIQCVLAIRSIRQTKEYHDYYKVDESIMLLNQTYEENKQHMDSIMITDLQLADAFYKNELPLPKVLVDYLNNYCRTIKKLSKNNSNTNQNNRGITNNQHNSSTTTNTSTSSHEELPSKTDNKDVINNNISSVELQSVNLIASASISSEIEKYEKEIDHIIMLSGYRHVKSSDYVKKLFEAVYGTYETLNSIPSYIYDTSLIVQECFESEKYSLGHAPILYRMYYLINRNKHNLNEDEQLVFNNIDKLMAMSHKLDNNRDKKCLSYIYKRLSYRKADVIRVLNILSKRKISREIKTLDCGYSVMNYPKMSDVVTGNKEMELAFTPKKMGYIKVILAYNGIFSDTEFPMDRNSNKYVKLVRMIARSIREGLLQFIADIYSNKNNISTILATALVETIDREEKEMTTTQDVYEKSRITMKNRLLFYKSTMNGYLGLDKMVENNLLENVAMLSDSVSVGHLQALISKLKTEHSINVNHEYFKSTPLNNTDFVKSIMVYTPEIIGESEDSRTVLGGTSEALQKVKVVTEYLNSVLILGFSNDFALNILKTVQTKGFLTPKQYDVIVKSKEKLALQESKRKETQDEKNLFADKEFDLTVVDDDEFPF